MIRAYHFVGATLRDGRPVPADGEWLTHDGPVEMCVSGLHASRCPFDALQYAPGATLCLVDCEDIITEHDDKLVCRRRRIVKRIDATELCRLAARRYALDAIHLWDAPAVVREYLETGREDLRTAAWAAARDAAWDAARDAAWDASWDAAWAAARAAAWAAARDAAWDAARDAAWDAARDAARDAQRRIFSEMVDRAFGGAR